MIVYVEGDIERYDASVVSDAISDVLSGGKKLRVDRLATKDYSGWRGQRSDCEYGMTPRHGNIVFGIGVEKEARGREWTSEEIREAVCFLANLDELKLDHRRRNLQAERAAAIREANVLTQKADRIAHELQAIEASSLFQRETVDA